MKRDEYDRTVDIDASMTCANGGNLMRPIIPERCGQCGSDDRSHRKYVGRLASGRREAKYAPCPNRWHSAASGGGGE